MKWKDIVTDYLTFTRKDRIGILVLSGLLLFIFFLPELLPRNKPAKPSVEDSVWMESIKQIELRNPEKDIEDEGYSYQYDRPTNNFHQELKPQLFYFDPNIMSSEEWKKLGLKDKTIHTIQNYLSKGGSFQRPEDLKKVYGLRPDDYERLAPFIRIETPQIKNISANKEIISTFKPNTFRYSVIDINDADTTSFISLPGIGSKLAARIVNFRDKLGGFYSILQVSETFGLSDSTYQKIKQYLKLENTSIRKININTTTIEELKSHPYIKWNLANPIIAYRNEHGPFSKLEDLKNIMVITEEIYNKIVPYLSIQ